MASLSNIVLQRQQKKSQAQVPQPTSAPVPDPVPHAGYEGAGTPPFPANQAWNWENFYTTNPHVEWMRNAGWGPGQAAKFFATRPDTPPEIAAQASQYLDALRSGHRPGTAAPPAPAAPPPQQAPLPDPRSSQMMAPPPAAATGNQMAQPAPQPVASQPTMPSAPQPMGPLSPSPAPPGSDNRAIQDRSPWGQQDPGGGGLFGGMGRRRGRAPGRGPTNPSVITGHGRGLAF